MSAPDPADEEASIYLAEQKAPKQKSSPIGAFFFFFIFVIVSVGVTLYGNRNGAPVSAAIGYTNSLPAGSVANLGVSVVLSRSADGFYPVADHIGTQFEFSKTGTMFVMSGSILPFWKSESRGSLATPILATNGIAVYARTRVPFAQLAFISRRDDSTNTSIMTVEWNPAASPRTGSFRPVSTVYPGAVMKNSGAASRLHGQTWTTPDSVTNVISHFESRLPTMIGSSPLPVIYLPGPGQPDDGADVLMLVPTAHHLGAIHAVRSKADGLTYFSVISLQQ
jgi:hypothetical protein